MYKCPKTHVTHVRFIYIIVANYPGLPGTVPEKYAMFCALDVRLPCPGYLQFSKPNRKNTR